MSKLQFSDYLDATNEVNHSIVHNKHKSAYFYKKKIFVQFVREKYVFSHRFECRKWLFSNLFFRFFHFLIWVGKSTFPTGEFFKFKI